MVVELGRTWEAEAGRSLGLSLTWSTDRVSRYTGFHKETIFFKGSGSTEYHRNIHDI